MELKQTENTNDAKEGATLLASVQVEFVNIYEETNEELALAMNCSNG